MSGEPDPEGERIWLVEVSEPGVDRRCEEVRGRTAVGSGVDPATGGLLLADERVASRHLVLDGTGSVLRVLDLGRDAGATIDGVRVRGSAEVPVGSSIVLGDSQLRVHGWV